MTLVLIETLQRIEVLTREHLHNRDRVLDQWRAYCMLQSRTVAVTQQDRVVRGMCRGVDCEGALVLQTDDGEVACISGIVSELC